MPSSVKVPRDLIDAVAGGNVVAFIGAGLSRAAGLPGWTELLEQLLTWGPEHGLSVRDQVDLSVMISRGELLTVAEDLRESYGEQGFHAALSSVFIQPDLEPSKAHLLVSEIPFRAILTTNYDTLLERAYVSCGKQQPRVYLQTQETDLALALRDEDLHIVKVHGCISSVPSIVLGRTDYRNLLHNNNAYRTYLRTVFTTKSVIFLGFSLTDPDIEAIQSEIRAYFHDFSAPHFALLPVESGDSVRHRRLEKDYGINVLPYASVGNHAGLEEFLIQLKADVSATIGGGSAERRFAALQMQLSADVQRLDDEKQCIGDDQYVRRLLPLLTHAWRAGSRRSAWTKLASALSSSNGMSLATRAGATVELADMMLQDEAASSALRHLKPLVEPGTTLETLPDSNLCARIRSLWARCLIEVYACDDAEKALVALLGGQTSAEERTGLLAALAELYLLQGNLTGAEGAVELASAE